MIRKTLIYTCIIFILYNLFIVVFKPSERLALTQNQWQANYIKAQNYVYQSKTYPVVVVGTSLANRLSDNILTDSVYNLAFAGGSIYTGLEIIKQAPHKPRIVFIETNVLIKDGDDKMVQSLFMPAVSTLKAYIPAMQEKNQPMLFSGNIEFHSYMARYVKEVVEYKVIPLFNKEYKPATPEASASAPAASQMTAGEYEKFVNERIDEYKKSYRQAPSESLHLDKLAEYINYFRAQQIKVVFFEMPIDAQLINLPYPSYIRNRVQQAFPEIASLPLDTAVNYTTTDGIHMDDPAAVTYTTYFHKQVEKIVADRIVEK